LNLVVAAPLDTNANGLPDAWEITYAVSDPDADADADGRNNLQEYQANTNPTNGTSAFRMLSLSHLPNGRFASSWSAVGGTRYRVQFANGQASGGLPESFIDVVRPLSNEMDASPWGVASTQTFIDDFTQTGGPPTNGARYYRVKITP
jgi:hypothetical protein